MMKPEPSVTTDPWVWRAVFADGGMLDEYDANAETPHGWSEVAAVAAQRGTRLAHIALMPTRAGLAAHCLTLAQAGGPSGGPSGDVTARFFRRRRLTVSPLTGAEVGARSDPITVLALEWPDHAAYTFFFSDGSVLVSDDLNAV